MMKKEKKSKLPSLLLLLLFAGAVWRGYHEFIPRGAQLTPYLIDGESGPVIVSPQGDVTLEVRYHDKKAGHRGYHYRTWIVAYDWRTGREVISEGFIFGEVRRGEMEFPLEWTGPHSFRVTYAKGAFDDGVVEEEVYLRRNIRRPQPDANPPQEEKPDVTESERS